MNLFGLLQSDGIQLKRVARTHGGEYAGPCPFCGGKDRFRVWPEHKGGRYWCRQCDKKGDAIQLLRDMHGLSYMDACLQLGVGPKLHNRISSVPIRQNNTFHLNEQITTPDDFWLEQVSLWLETFQEWLWEEKGKDALDFLHSKGLSNETIKTAGLGWNCTNRFRTREEWGLPTVINPNGKPKKLYIPIGIVIPSFADNRIVMLKVRCDDVAVYSRYILIPGSIVQPMIWGPHKSAFIIVESELDGILLNQEAGDLVGVIALGSAQTKPDKKTHEALSRAKIILNALDTDDAGAKAAWSFWPQTYGTKVKRWPCIMGKDPSAALQQGLDIRTWVVVGLFGTEVKFERFCIQTRDGELSDEEAFIALGFQ